MSSHKGIDDLLAAGGSPRRLNGIQVDEFFERVRLIHENESPEIQPEDVQVVSPEAARPPFPVEIFPEPIRVFVEQVAKATGCPLDFPAVAAVVVGGAAIGAARAICVKQGWDEQPGMYAAIVAPPGRVKTPALKAVMNPLHEEQDRLHQDYAATVKRYQEDLVAYKQSQRRPHVEVDDILNEPASAPTKPPPMRHVFTSDTTVEALAAILESNPKGLLIFRDEFTAWVHSMNQYRRGGADRQFYLSAWSNETIKVDRKTSLGGPLIVRFPFLSVLGGVQPDMLSSLEAKGGAEDGFLDRLLFSYPEDQPFQGWTDAEMEEETQNEWQYILGRLLALEPHRPEGPPTCLVLSISSRTASQHLQRSLTVWQRK